MSETPGQRGAGSGCTHGFPGGVEHGGRLPDGRSWSCHGAGTLLIHESAFFGRPQPTSWWLRFLRRLYAAYRRRRR